MTAWNFSAMPDEGKNADVSVHIRDRHFPPPRSVAGPKAEMAMQEIPLAGQARNWQADAYSG
jgi:hypothetical protein